MYIAALSILLWVKFYPTDKDSEYFLAYIYILIRAAPSTLGTFRLLGQPCFGLVVRYSLAFQPCRVSGRVF